MIEIIPAIIPHDFAQLHSAMEAVVSAIPLVQIDICDGSFVQARSWPYGKHDDNFERIMHEEDGMPFWEKLDFEVHLMINNPETTFDTWMKAGARRILIHPESATDIVQVVKNFHTEFGYARDSLAPEIGIVLKLDTLVEVLESLASEIDCVQCMGIAKLGYQGQPFDERVIEKVKSIHARYPELTIAVDGGVTYENAPMLLEAGATRLVFGSAIYGSDNPRIAIRQLSSLR